MSVDIIMPKMGESIMEGTILKWHKKPGDKINVDETILEISTDKVDTEVPSPESGIVSELLYKEGDDAYVFMNQETFEQINIEKQQIEGVDFLKEGDVVDVVSNDDNVLYAELAPKVALKITYTEPGLKGDTATNALKPATVETGATVRVPLFINDGEEIIVDTRDGSYLQRVKE